MGKFFSRVSTKGEAPQIASFANLTTFYSLLLFLIAIPFILIVALVWLTGILGFSTWIIAGVVVLGGVGVWLVYRRWKRIKAQLAAQGGEFKDIVREAAKDGKDVEVSLLKGLISFRYHGNRMAPPVALPYATPDLLALEAPSSARVETITAARGEEILLNPSQLRRELEGFIRLRDTGVISPDEFDQIRNRLLERFPKHRLLLNPMRHNRAKLFSIHPKTIVNVGKCCKGVMHHDQIVNHISSLAKVPFRAP